VREERWIRASIQEILVVLYRGTGLVIATSGSGFVDSYDKPRQTGHGHKVRVARAPSTL
jgi:hypothetical protein